MVETKKLLVVVLSIFLIVFSIILVSSLNDLMALQGNVLQDGSVLASGNLTVYIFDSMIGGNIIYNSTGDFNNSIVNGKYDVMLGNGSRELSLEYGKVYYMEIYINNEKFSFNGSNRQIFQSSIGQINGTYIFSNQINSSHLELNIDLKNATNIQAHAVNKSTGISFVGKLLDEIIDTLSLYAYNQTQAVIPLGPNSTLLTTSNITDWYNYSLATFNQYGHLWYNYTLTLNTTFDYNQTSNSIYYYNQTMNWTTNGTAIISKSGIEQIQIGNTLINTTSGLFWYNQTNLGGWNWSGNNIYQNDLSDNVGIGTKIPEDLLNIYGGQLKINDTIGTTSSSELDSSLLIERTNSGSFLGARLKGGANRFFMSMDTANIYYIALGTDSLRFGTDNSDDLTIISGGNIGIGTTAPTQLLDVRGHANFSGNVYVANGTTVINTTSGLFWYNQSNVADVTKWQYNQTNLGGWNWSGNNVYQNDLSDYVGIGTKTPSQKLDVLGGIAYGTDASHKDFLEVAQYKVAGPITNVTIYTNISFFNFYTMPYIKIDGYSYGGGTDYESAGEVIGLTIVAYVYNGNFINYGMSSFGTYIPEYVSLFNNTNGKIGIMIYDGGGLYLPKIKVSARKTVYEEDGNFNGWSVDSNGMPAGVSDVVNLTAEVTAQKIGINKEDPVADLDVRGYGMFTGDLYVANTTKINVTSGLFWYNQSNVADITKWQYNQTMNWTTNGTAIIPKTGISQIQIGNTLINTTSGLFWYNQTNLGGWNWSGNNIYQNDLSDNVGIGTKTPTHSLSINGSTGTLLNISGTLGEIYTKIGARQLVLTGLPTGTAFNNAPLVINAIGSGSEDRKLFGVGVANSERFSVDEDGDVIIINNLTVNTNTLFVDGDNNRVGIGTTTPTQLLDVRGHANFSGNVYVANLTVINKSSGLFWYNQTSNSVYNYNQTNLGGWNWSGNNIYQNDLSDNVGIGTKTPTHTLNVVGTLNVSGSETKSTGGLIVNASGGVGIGDMGITDWDYPFVVKGKDGVLGNTGMRLIKSQAELDKTLDLIPGTSSNVSASYGLALTTGSPYPMLFYTAGVERMRILGTGNIGIGTSAPTQLLDVRGHANFSGNVYVANGTTVINTTSGLFWYNQTSNSVYNYNQTNLGGWNWSGNNIYQNDLSDNVGIGTKTPQRKLQLSNGKMIIDDTVTGLTSNGSQASLLINVDDSKSFLGADYEDKIHFFMYLDSSSVYYRTLGQKNLKFGSNGNDYLTISSLGKIGMGTTAPTQLLDVRGHANFSGNVYVANGTTVINSSSGLFWYNQTSNSVYNYNQTNLGGWNWSGNNIYQNDLSDYVGIGTKIPESLLNIYGGQLKINDTIGTTSSSELTSSLLIERTNGGSFLGARLKGGANRFFMYMDSDNIYYRTLGTDSLRFGTDNSDDLIIKGGSGYIGIGTTAPTQLLDVRGNIFTSGDLLLNSSSQVDFYDEIGDKAYWYSNSYGTGIESATLTNWANTRHRWRIGGTNVSGGTEKMTLTSTGLAIGGGDATQTLTVNGNASITGNLTVGLNTNLSGNLFVGGATITLGTDTTSGTVVIPDGSLCVGNSACSGPDTDGRILAEGSLTVGTTSDKDWNQFGNGERDNYEAIVDEDDVYITGDLEVDGNAYFGGTYGPGDIAESMHTKESKKQSESCQQDVSCLLKNTNDNLNYGDLVCTDTTENKLIKKCDEPNSRLVLGFISETAVLNVGTAKGYPIALAGLVNAHVTNENGNIIPGDLLVSSSTPGYVMKNNNPSPGTVVGKSLEYCKQKDCKIQVFVTLS